MRRKIMTTSIPVILDTDIGQDIDDMWALSMLLKSPELDLKLISVSIGDVEYRARLTAKYLEEINRTDIPIAVGSGAPADPIKKMQARWIDGYDVNNYPGTIHKNGVDKLIDTILESDEIIDLICIGPLTTISDALKQAPEIAKKCRFRGMHGSVYKRHNGLPGRFPEYNVAADIEAVRIVFAADWQDILITPLDTCGQVRISGDLFNRLRASDDPMVKVTLENFRLWSRVGELMHLGVTSILFDTVAVYLSYNEDLVEIDELPLIVEDDGRLKISETGNPIRVALNWKNLEGYRRHLTGRLLGEEI